MHLSRHHVDALDELIQARMAQQRANEAGDSAAWAEAAARVAEARRALLLPDPVPQPAPMRPVVLG